MAAAHSHDEQPRSRWPLNKSPEASGRVFVSPTDAPAGDASAVAAGRAEVRGGATAAAPGEATPVSPSPRLGYTLHEYVETQRYRLDPDYLDTLTSPADDTVLGLRYSTIAPRQAVGDSRWSGALRVFARAVVWCLPAAVILLALSSVVGWPTADGEPSLLSPGGWVLATAAGLGLWVAGVVALSALVASMPVRPWGLAATLSSIVGMALLAPVVGAVGFGRPAISRAASAVENDPAIEQASASMQTQVLGHTAGRSLLIAGAILLGLGAVAMAFAVLGSRVLNRTDAWLIMLGVALAGVAAYLSWEFLLTLAAMVMLAATLGLAFTASRIAPDGTAPPAY
jgi:hypothetical protein